MKVMEHYIKPMKQWEYEEQTSTTPTLRIGGVSHTDDTHTHMATHTHTHAESHPDAVGFLPP